MKKVLYIEDNLADVAFFEEALKDNGNEVELKVISDAEKLISYIKDSESTNSESLPDLIITDVSLPKINGQEIIRRLKESEHLKHINVVAYSTSSYEKDIESCMQNGASAYFQKPMNYYDTCALINDIFDKWLVSSN